MHSTTNVWIWEGEIGVRGAGSFEHAARLILADPDALTHVRKFAEGEVTVAGLLDSAQWRVMRVPSAYFASKFADGWPAPGVRTDFETPPGRGGVRVVWVSFEAPTPFDLSPLLKEVQRITTNIEHDLPGGASAQGAGGRLCGSDRDVPVAAERGPLSPGEPVVFTEQDELAEIVWAASRADEGTISATGAKFVAASIMRDWPPATLAAEQAALIKSQAALLDQVRAICADHWGYQTRREAKFGREGSGCVCEICNVMRALEAWEADRG